MRGFTGPFGVFVRSYAYIRSYGPELREMSEAAVLNANYLLARLKDAYDLPFDRLCMHEFVLSARTLKREHGISALDVAKRLMDYGIHPPTIYFPLIVPEALMIEPTETEPKERLDEFCDAMLAIAREAAATPSSSTGRRTAGRSGGSTRSRRRSASSSATGSRSIPTSSDEAAPASRRGAKGRLVDRRERERILGEHAPRGPTLHERRLADRLEADLEGSPLRGRPLARRLRNFTVSADRYALSLAGPPAHVRRLREIEDEIAGHEEALHAAWTDLSRRFGSGSAEFARRWRELAARWRFDAVNELIRLHNQWYPAEARLPMDPRTGDFVLVGGAAVPPPPPRRGLGPRALPGRARARGLVLVVGLLDRDLSRTAH